MKRLLILAIWLPSVFLTLLSALLFQSYRSRLLLASEKPPLPQPVQTYQMYASFPKTLGVSTVKIKKEDAVPELVFQYLEKYKSPMASSAASFTTIFRNYQIDPILALAIAQCESNLGKKVPENCFNPFGLGIHSKGRLCFENWQQSYEKMAKTLKHNYYDKGYDTTEKIMTKYCPNSLEKGGSWAKCVEKFIKEIKTFNTP